MHDTTARIKPTEYVTTNAAGGLVHRALVDHFWVIFFVRDRKVTNFEKTHFISGVIFIDGHFSGIPWNHSGKIFINGHFSVTALIYETEKWLSSVWRFTDSRLRKWVIIRSSPDTIIEQNDWSFFSHFSVISDPSGI